MILGTLMRMILAEAHATMPFDQDGPFYVTYDRGDFTLYPFGSAQQRWCYRVLPTWIVPGSPFPEWTFVVLGEW